MTRGECTPEQIAECPLYVHFTDTHHLYHPASNYRTKIEKKYRELPSHKVQLCRNEHNEIHATQEAPTKPDRNEMLRAIASQATREALYESQVDRG